MAPPLSARCGAVAADRATRVDAFQTITIGAAPIRHLRINRSGEVMALCEVVRDRAHDEHPADMSQREASTQSDARPGSITCQRCRTALGLAVSR